MRACFTKTWHFSTRAYQGLRSPGTDKIIYKLLFWCGAKASQTPPAGGLPYSTQAPLLHYLRYAWAVFVIYQYHFDWLFAPITWDTTSWMLFLVSLALYEIMKIKVVISSRCLIRWNQRYSVICFMCDATLAAKVLETLRWKTSHTDGQNTGRSWKHGIHTLYANFVESSSPWNELMRMLCRTRHLCLSSPLIGGSLQVPGVICAAECGVAFSGLAHPPWAANVSGGETPAVEADSLSEDASLIPFSGV